MNDKSKDKEGGSPLAAVFQSFYTDLLLRDLFGKAAPGMIILLTIAVSLTSFETVLSNAGSASFGVWMVVVALAWITGLSAQGVGELAWVGYFPKNVSLDTYQQKLISFRKAATPKQERDFERHTVIAEATGNGSVALLVAAAVLLVARSPDIVSKESILVVALVVAMGALIRMHREVLKRRYNYLQLVIQQPQDATPTQDATPSPSK